MPMQAVATQLQLSLTEVQQVVTGLAAGGVLTDVRDDRLSVRPPTLRYALVRDVFFAGARSIPYGELIRQSPDAVETTLTLIGARARGAAVPDDLLCATAERVDSNRVWEAFSHLGSNECAWLLEHHPDKLPVVAEAALGLVPQKAIPVLLSRAIGDTRQLHSNPDHPLRQIEDWVKSAEPGTSHVISYRKTLLDSTLSWFAESSNAHLALQAIVFALSPTFADSEMDPGSGLKVTFRSGLITQAEMSTIRGLWPRVRKFLQATSIDDWGPVFHLMREWLYPNLLAKRVPEETRSSMRDFACEIATDIVGMNPDHPGVLSYICRIVKPLGIELPLDLDPEFDALFPVEERGQGWEKARAEQTAAADRLAKRWSSQAAKDIATRVVRFETEARAADLTWPRWSPSVAERIAAEVQSPSTWAREFIRAGADSDLVAPFVQVTASCHHPEYPELLKICLEEPRLHFAGVSVGLTATSLPSELLSGIMSVIDDRFSTWIEVACARLEIPGDRVAALLTHPVRSVAAAAATGEWQATPRGTVRESLRDPWREAVINCFESEYEGEEIFRGDPSVAFEWLQLRMIGTRTFSYHENLLNVALQVVSLEQRKLLLEQIGDGFWHDEVVHGIVGNKPEVYRILLQNQRLKRFHLSPLAGSPAGLWIDKALLALDAGYSTSDVAEAVYGSIQSWSGSESAHWAEWAESFEPLLTHDDERIRTVGQIGKDRALARREQALARERLADIRGRLD